MKASDIDNYTTTVAKFATDISKFEEELAIEAPALWGDVLAAINKLVNGALVLTKISETQATADLEMYNKFAEANGLEPKKFLKDDDREINLEYFRKERI